MKALTILQPWANLILTGEKRIETRPWRTAYRGPLLIHAGLRFRDAARQLLDREPYRSTLRRHGCREGTDLPRGVLLGSVELVDCVPAEEIDESQLQERALGDYTPGRWAWLLRSPRPLPRFVPCRGALSLFDVDEVLLEADLPLPSILTYARPLVPELSRTA